MLRINARRLAAVLIMATSVAPGLLVAQESAPPPAVWLEAGPSLAPGETAQLGYNLPRSGYLTVLRAGTDGDVSVVYPARPNIRSSEPKLGAIPLRADAAPGVGYLFWITSSTPFDFRRFAAPGGRWAAGSLQRRGDPFEAVDRFARGTTHGRYSVGYSSYRVGTAAHDTRRAPAVHDGDYGNDGYGYSGYGYSAPYSADAYGGGYGYGDYSGWWGGPEWDGYAHDTWRHRRGWRDGEYERAYDRASYYDPRSRYLRHCADGTLAPYTVPCSEVTQRGSRPDRRIDPRGRP